jgi:nuclear pore complex protein Nup205
VCGVLVQNTFNLVNSFAATIPTIGDVLEALNDLCFEFAEILKQISDLSGEIASKDHLRVDNIREASLLSILGSIRRSSATFQILDPSEIQVFQDLDVRQKRSAIRRVLERRRRDTKNTAKTLLSTELHFLDWPGLTINETDSAEMLLLLLWRHLLYYSEGDHSHRQQKSPTMRFLPAPNPEELRVDIGRKLAPALQRLTSLDLVRLAFHITSGLYTI